MAHRCLVSVNSPLTGSTTVLSKTPVCKPMFKNKVGLFLSTVVSKISARQMDVGGAVKAYVRVKAVSEVRNDSLSRITYLQTECRKCVLHLHRDDMDGLVLTTDSLWGQVRLQPGLVSKREEDIGLRGTAPSAFQPGLHQCSSKLRLPAKTFAHRTLPKCRRYRPRSRSTRRCSVREPPVACW